MIRKRHLICSAILSSLLISCGGGGSEDGSHTSSVNTNSMSKFVASGEYFDDLKYEPTVLAFEAQKKILKNMTASQLAVVNGDCDGKYSNSGKCANGKMLPRWVKIPKDFAQRDQEINGSILTGVKDSRICLDLNEDNLCGSEEPLAITTDESHFILKLTDEQKNLTNNIIAVRGVNTNSNRNETTILKGENKNGVILSPYSTLMALNPSKADAIRTMYPNMDSNSTNNYKDALLLQKTIDILVASYDLKDDKKIINQDVEVYKLLANNLGTSLKNTVSALNNEHVNRAKTAVEKMIDEVDAINLQDDDKEALAVVLTDRLNDAKEHFRKNSGDLELDDIDGNNLKRDAIKSRLVEIGVEGIDDALMDAVEQSGLSITDMEDFDKVSEAVKNYPELKKLKDQLEKKNNATSDLIILKALLVGDRLEVYFSDNEDLGLSDESEKLLSGEGKSEEEIKHIVEKVYTIEGLQYEVKSISFDKATSRNTIYFKTSPSFKDGPKRLKVNYLALKDTRGKYTREKQVYSIIESLRGIPATGQQKVWVQGDDGSFNYGLKLKHKKVDKNGDITWVNEKTNLMWQDAQYKEGENQNITYGEALNYCSDLTYAGYSDWRLPNVKEIITTTSVNMQEKGMFTYYSKSEISFTDSSQNVALGERAIGADKYGQVTNLISNSADEKGKYSARCVRTLHSEKPSLFPDAAFDNIVILEKDKTSYDPSTGVVYLDTPFTQEEIDVRKRASEEGSKNVPSVGRYGTLEHGVKYCAKLNENSFGGFNNWRMANVNEVFYSLNAQGTRTFQHRLDGFDYTLTSTSSLKDKTKYPWIVGNFFNRKTINNRSKGFFRCVASMDKKPLKTQKPVDSIPRTDLKRKYSLDFGAKSSVDITLPANIFDKYEGISITALDPLNYLENRQYEISRIIPKTELYPGYSLESVKVDGKDICTPATEWVGISQRPGSYCEEKGLFRVYLDKDLTLNRYGKSLLESGKTYAIKIRKRIDLDTFTINLTIGQNEQIQDNISNVDTSSDGFSVKVDSETLTSKDIHVAVSSGYRVGGSPNILNIIESNSDFRIIQLLDPDGQTFSCEGKTGAEFDKCYKTFANKLGSLADFKIVSGDKDIFEVWHSKIGSYLHVKPLNRLALKVGKTYSLQIAVINPQTDEQIGELIDINVIVDKSTLETKNVTKDIKDANDYKLNPNGEPVLFTIDKGFATKNWKNEPINEHKIDPFITTNAELDDIMFELKNSDDTYDIKRVEFYGSKYYAVILNKGKNPPASKTLRVVAKIPYKDTVDSDIKWITSEFDLAITNNESLTYANIAAKINQTHDTEVVSDRPMPRDEIIKEKLDVKLSDVIIDNSYKIYPSDMFVVVGKNFIKTNQSLTDVSFEIVGGAGKEHFEKELTFYIDGYVLKLKKSNLPPAGVYELKMKAKKGDMESDEATLKFEVFEVAPPGVIDSLEVNLANRNANAVYLSKSDNQSVIPLFLLHNSSLSFESLELIDREDPVNGQPYGNLKFNGTEVDEEKYELVSSSDNKYYIRKTYRGSLKEPIYSIFLHAGKTAEDGDELKVKVIGTFNGQEYPNPNLVTIHVKGSSYTNESTEDYENYQEPGSETVNPHDASADPKFILKPEYTKTTDDPIRLDWRKIGIAIDNSTFVEYVKDGEPYVFELVDNKDKFSVEVKDYNFYQELVINFKNSATTGSYDVKVRAKYNNSDKWSNTTTIHFEIQ